MAYPQLTPEMVAQARAANDLPILAQLRCSREAAEALTERGADVTFTDEFDAEVVIPAGLSEAQRLEIAVLAGQLPLVGYEGRPRAVRNADGSWKIFSLLD